jgi:hypothetical protein
MQMWANQDACDVANANVTTLLDVWILLGFHCFLALLELFHGFVKIVQAQDIFVMDFIKVVNLVKFKYGTITV